MVWIADLKLPSSSDTAKDVKSFSDSTMLLGTVLLLKVFLR